MAIREAAHSSVGRPRRIKRDLRPDGPLVYERLSDPILVRRSKDGDKLALATLCERHAPRVERIALHVLPDPEDARDAAQESLVKLVQRVGQFKGEAQFHLAAPPRRQHLQGRRAGPVGFGAPHRAARTRTRGSPPTVTRLAPSPHSEARARARPLPRRAARAQARVVVLQDAFDVPFDEISAATGLPVGTAKCYAHRGRNGLRERSTA